MSNLVKQIIIGAVAFIIIGVAVGFGVTMVLSSWSASSGSWVSGW